MSATAGVDVPGGQGAAPLYPRLLRLTLDTRRVGMRHREEVTGDAFKRVKCILTDPALPPQTYLFLHFVLPVQGRFHRIEKLVLVDETVGSLLSTGVGVGGEGRGLKVALRQVFVQVVRRPSRFAS